MVRTHVDNDSKDQQIRQEEEERLNRTLNEITKQLDDAKQIADGRLGEVIATRTEMWQDAPKVIRDFDDAVVFNQLRQVLEQQEREYIIYKQLIPRLERLKESAYFGRIDFQPADQSEAIPIYIGTSSLIEQTSGEHLIYDWRAPISSLYYDNEPGPARFEAADQTIEGSLLLKRQYKIEGDTIVYLFDTDLKIDDDMLQSILGRTAAPHMRTIIQSIQREQNQAIRDDNHDLLIVLGPAGSGKTSIALHRIAYILYRERGRIDSKSIVIISPNDIFGDYISRVLPDLGEENTPQTTFFKLAVEQIQSITPENPLTIESPDRQLEYLLAGKHVVDRAPGTGQDDKYEAKKRDIGLKGSFGFYNALRAFVDKLTSGAHIPFTSIKWNEKEILSKEDLLELLTETYSYLPFRNRLEKIARRITFLMEPMEQQRLNEIKRALIEDPDEPHLPKRELNRRARAIIADETSQIKDAVNKMTVFNSLQAFGSLFNDADALWSQLGDKDQMRFSVNDVRAVCQSTIQRLRSGRLAAQDIPPLLTFLALLGDVKPYEHVKHVVMDEAQDYSVMHFEALRLMFPKATFTLVGDPDQSIHPVRPETDWDALPSILGTRRSKTVHLLTSYRQTKQLAQFARSILPREDIRIIDRPGEKPRALFVHDQTHIARVALDEIGRWKAEGFDLIAVICKTTAESKKAFAALQAGLNQDKKTGRPDPSLPFIKLATADDNTMEEGILVLPAYLAKGLEFDAVLIYDAGQHAYVDESERSLFYTTCTRALHRLSLIVTDPPSPLFQMIDSELYDSVHVK